MERAIRQHILLQFTADEIYTCHASAIRRGIHSHNHSASSRAVLVGRWDWVFAMASFLDIAAMQDDDSDKQLG